MKVIDDYMPRIEKMAASHPWAWDMLNGIGRELDERYMELPVDADGVPIHAGDEVSIDPKSPTVYEVEAVGDGVVVLDGMFTRPADECRRVKPDPVKELLALFLTACGDDDPHHYDEQIGEYAAKLREVM